jgi:hypothetical protein
MWFYDSKCGVCKLEIDWLSSTRPE